MQAVVIEYQQSESARHCGGSRPRNHFFLKIVKTIRTIRLPTDCVLL